MSSCLAANSNTRHVGRLFYNMGCIQTSGGYHVEGIVHSFRGSPPGFFALLAKSVVSDALVLGESDNLATLRHELEHASNAQEMQKLQDALADWPVSIRRFALTPISEFLAERSALRSNARGLEKRRQWNQRCLFNPSLWLKELEETALFYYTGLVAADPTFAAPQRLAPLVCALRDISTIPQYKSSENLEILCHVINLWARCRENPSSALQDAPW